jgi:diacylglycerol kinase (ATP)
MEPNKNMSLRSRGNSFKYAFNGLYQIFRYEPNARLHAIAASGVITAGCIMHISPAKWIALVFAIGMVWITEALNTCIEKLCDFACDNKLHPAIKIIKDIAAAAVLIAAGVSIVAGIIVFFF